MAYAIAKSADIKYFQTIIEYFGQSTRFGTSDFGGHSDYFHLRFERISRNSESQQNYSKAGKTDRTPDLFFAKAL